MLIFRGVRVPVKSSFLVFWETYGGFVSVLHFLLRKLVRPFSRPKTWKSPMIVWAWHVPPFCWSCLLWFTPWAICTSSKAILFFFVCFKLGGCLGVRFGNGALGGYLRVKNPWVFNSEKDLERKKPSPIITSSLLEVFWKVKYWGGDGGWRKVVEDGWLMICSNWNIYEQIILENNPFFDEKSRMRTSMCNLPQSWGSLELWIQDF